MKRQLYISTSNYTWSIPWEHVLKHKGVQNGYCCFRGKHTKLYTLHRLSLCEENTKMALTLRPDLNAKNTSAVLFNWTLVSTEQLWDLENSEIC